MEKYDKIIIGAGLYGMYSALFCGLKKQKVLVLECEQMPFQRATYINQARVHQGYHYPRSISTAMKSAEYFERFCKDFSFCIHRQFEKVYATSNSYSWSNGEQFKSFCKAANIPCQELKPERFFKNRMCDAAFLTQEYSFDAIMLKNYFLKKIEELNNVDVLYGVRINRIEQINSVYAIQADDNQEYCSEFVLNVTYAGINQVLNMVGFESLKIKYELCEIILCEVNEILKRYGFTVMDGPFFSIMPFGRTGYHSLTSVTFTPHNTSFEELPTFPCQKESYGYCSIYRLGNCNNCPAKPKTAFPYMVHLTRKYLKDEFVFNYHKSLFSMKPILMSSEIDDSRPTVIKTYSKNPTFIGVLSGKISTIYDLDEVLSNEK